MYKIYLSIAIDLDKKTAKMNYHKLIFTILLTILFLSVTSINICLASTMIKWSCEIKSDNDACAKKRVIEYIYIYGEINYEDETQLETINGIYPLNKIFPPIYINSPGGDVDVAIHIGRILRERSAYIEGKDMIHPENQVICDSACVLIASGAIQRNLLQIGLHKGFIAKRIKGERHTILPLKNEDMYKTYNYLDEMGISEEVAKIISKTNYDDMREFYFSLDEPFRDQDIVRLGFRMREPNNDERKRLYKLRAKFDEGLAGNEKLATEGDLNAIYNLAKYYLYGRNGEPINQEVGLKWLIKAADSGLSIAQHNLAVIYLNGDQSTNKDIKKAVKYFKMAANSGLAASQNNLGWMYYKGRGVEKCLPNAIYWITQSLEQGEGFAYDSMGEIFFDGNGFDRDNIQTYKWLKLAATHMPKGSSYDKNFNRLQIIKNRMSADELKDGDRLVSEWKPLKQASSIMRDKDDK